MLKKMQFGFPAFLALLGLLLITLAKCQFENGDDEEGMLKKTKVLACIAVSKARLIQDTAFVDALVDKINQHFKITDGRNKVLSLALVNCYSRITKEKAFEIITSMHSSGELDSLAEDKKELLGLTDSDSSASQLNKESFAKDFQDVNVILQELNREHAKLKESRSDDEQEYKPNKPNKPNKQPGQEGPSFLFQLVNSYVNFWKGIIAVVMKLCQIDNFFGIAFLIVFAFMTLNFIKNLCAPKKKKKVLVDTPNNVSKPAQAETSTESSQKTLENNFNNENKTE